MTNNNRDKGIRSERDIAKKLQAAAGRVNDPVLVNLVTDTGRVGQLTSLGFDILVGNPETNTALVGEAKRRKVFLGADALRALIQVATISYEWNRQPVLGFELPTETVPEFVPTKRGKRRLDRRWLVATLPYACELLRARRELTVAKAFLEELGRLEEFNTYWQSVDAPIEGVTEEEV